MDASLDFVLRVGPESVREHNRQLIELLFERLPKDCILAKGGGRDQFIEVIEMTAQAKLQSSAQSRWPFCMVC